MPHPLDQQRRYRTTARQLVLTSLRWFARQCRRGFVDARGIRFPQTYRRAREVLVCGMGGSTLGTDVLRSVFARTLKVPLRIVNDYTLPASTSHKSLVILSSYSGSTEEVLSAAREARRRGALITGLTRGGALGQLLRRFRVPWYKIDGGENPSDQPRLGLGYNAMGQLGLLTSMGFLRVPAKDITRAVRTIEERSAAMDSNVPFTRNLAKRLAQELEGRSPILVGVEHLQGSMHAFANQLNETAKSFAAVFPLPELNHHLLEGLRFPRGVRQMTFVFANSSLYSPRLQQRQRITKEIVERHGIATLSFAVRGKTPLEQAFDLLTISGYLTFYLSVLHHVDPTAIPSVDELKRRLGRLER